MDKARSLTQETQEDIRGVLETVPHNIKSNIPQPAEDCNRSEVELFLRYPICSTVEQQGI